jgi:hemerythrin
MQALAWQPHYLTGLPQVDDDHRTLLNLINQLDPDHNDLTPRSLGRLLEVLDNFVRTHFEHEQGLMEEAGYELIGAHRQMHNVFCRRLEQFAERHRGGEQVSAELHAMLARWVVDHIHGDKSYSGQVYTHMRQRQDPRGGNWLNRTMRAMFN